MNTYKDKAHKVERTEYLTAVGKSIRELRKQVKEESRNYSNLVIRYGKKENSYKQWIEWEQLNSRLNAASFEARSLNLVAAFRNGTPFKKVEFYGFDQKTLEPFRQDGKPIKRNRHDMLMRCLEQRKAIETACSMVAIEEREAFMSWTRVGEVGTNP